MNGHIQNDVFIITSCISQYHFR